MADRREENLARLAELIDAATLQAFQDGLAAISHTMAVICDQNGKPVIGVSGHHDAVALLQSTAGGRKRLEQVFQNICHAAAPTAITHLHFEAAAITHRGRQIGCMIVGGRPKSAPDATQLQDIASAFGLDPDRTTELAAACQPWRPLDHHATTTVVGMMADILSKLVAQSLQLRTREETLGTVYNVAAMFSGTQDLQDILSGIAREVTDAMQAKSCSIRLLNESTGELIIKAVYNLSQAYLDKGAVLLEENPIDRAAFNGEIVYVEEAATDPRTRYPQQAREEGIVSGLSVGMTYRGQTVGVMRVYTGIGHRFTTAEKALLRSISSQAAAAIIHSRLYLEALAGQRYQRQLSYAGEIQRRMIPARPPDHRGVDLAFAYEPSFHVGGDFLDFLEFSHSEALGVCVADVVGKGIPAALLMASLRTAFRLYAHGGSEITETMTMTNIHLCGQTLISEFATMFYGVFNATSRSFTYCNAGHNPALLLRKESFRRLEDGGMILGVDSTQSYEKKTVALRKGDVIVLYTDGVIDAENFSGETFGSRRFQESVLQHSGEEASLMAQNILWDIRRFVGLADQADDITLILAKIV